MDSPPTRSRKAKKHRKKSETTRYRVKNQVKRDDQSQNRDQIPGSHLHSEFALSDISLKASSHKKQRYPKRTNFSRKDQEVQVKSNAQIKQQHGHGYNRHYADTSQQQQQRHTERSRRQQCSQLEQHQSRRHQQRQRFRREDFLQANYQFWLKADTDTNSSIFSDPDALLCWDSVEEVCYSSTKESIPKCPICLERPVVPCITRCGHIFCKAPCLYRYLSYSDHFQWRKCPLCNESIYRRAVKSLRIVELPNVYTSGAMVEFCLMKRPKSSIFASPYNLHNSNQNINFTSFHRIHVMSNDTSSGNCVETVLIREKTAFNALLIESKADIKEEQETTIFIQMAIDEISSRQQEMEAKKELQKKEEEKHVDEDKDDINSDDHDNDAFFFYQANDGQNVFLYSLVYRALLQEAIGSIQKLSPLIKGRVVQLEKYHQTLSNRQRFRFLSHLSLTTSFSFVELDLRSISCLSQTTSLCFKEEVEHRAAQRRHDEDMRLKQEAKMEKIQQSICSFPCLQEQELYHQQDPNPLGLVQLSNAELRQALKEKSASSKWAKIADKGFASEVFYPPLLPPSSSSSCSNPNTSIAASSAWNKPLMM